MKQEDQEAEEEMPMPNATRIKLICLGQQLNTNRFAKLANIHPQVASALLRGSYRAGPAVQEKVCSALGVAPGEIFGNHGWPLPPEA